MPLPPQVFAFAYYHYNCILAAKEAEHIISKRSFGSHANFQKWRKSVHNKYLAELSLLVNTEGKIPRKRLFAKVFFSIVRILFLDYC